MTQDEFLKRYHTYNTGSKEEAEAEADRANTEGVEGNTAVAVDFSPFGYGLMLGTAYDLIADVLRK